MIGDEMDLGLKEKMILEFKADLKIGLLPWPRAGLESGSIATWSVLSGPYISGKARATLQRQVVYSMLT